MLPMEFGCMSFYQNPALGRSSIKKKMKVWILSKGGGGGRTHNLNFWYFILVELLNLVTDKFNPIFGPNFRGRGGSEKLWTKYILSFFFNDDLP